MCGDQIDKFRLPNNLPVYAQKPGIPFQVLDVFFAKPPFDDHFLKRFVLKGHAAIIFRHRAIKYKNRRGERIIFFELF